jgi:hypothetical protein
MVDVLSQMMKITTLTQTHMMESSIKKMGYMGGNSSDGRRQRAKSSSSGCGIGSRRGRPPLGRPHDVPEEERLTSDSSEDEQVRVTDDEGDA